MPPGEPASTSGASGRIDDVRSILATLITHLVLDGVAEGALGVGLDVVDAAARLARVRAEHGEPPGTLRQRVVSLGGDGVRAGTGRAVAVDGALSPRALRQGDVLVVPGLSAATEPALDALLARDDVRAAARAIARLAERGVFVAASCSATFVLGASGALDGRSATTTWWLGGAFARRFPAVRVDTSRMVVDADGVLTAGSAFAHADLALALVTRLAGPSLAHLVAKYLVLDERSSQARYMVREHLRSADPGLRALEAFVARNLGRQLPLEELARAAGTSPRTLARRVRAALGTTPQGFVQRQRVAHAAHLLETTQLPVEEVAARVGYADAAAFRRVFRRHTGEAPRDRRVSP